MYIKINIWFYNFTTSPEGAFVSTKHTLKEDIGNNYNLLNMLNHYKQIIICKTFIYKVKLCIIKDYIAFITF